MLRFLRGKGQTSDRKLRLYACACCRRISSLLSHQELRKGVETAERYADREAAYQDMVGAAKAADWLGWSLLAKDQSLSNAVWAATAMNLWYWFRPVTRTMHTVRHLLSYDEGQAPHQAALLRDIIANPFRRVSLNPSWLTPKVALLAEHIYHEHAFEKISALADVLEEAGCTSAELLQHFRQQGQVHCRGCWGIDLLLDKE